MPKLKTVHICSNCGTQFPKWMGQCSACGEWNTMVEDVVDTGKNRGQGGNGLLKSAVVRKISDTDHTVNLRYSTGFSEIDRVLGGGVVSGSVILLGGEPGIGKSTLTIQMLDKLSDLKRIFYVAGEESTSQIGIRAKRLGLTLNNVEFIESNVFEEIMALVESEKPDFVVIDSIQVVRSQNISGIAGGLSQIRYITDGFVQIAKSKSIPFLIIGHVTKDGELAGPKVLEHLVDAVLYIEGDKINSYRFLKAAKNRFGSTDEVGIFNMLTEGLVEVADPSKEFIGDKMKSVMGSALSCTMEGNRPLVVEIQALTSKSNFGYPKRSATGFDLNRLMMIIAVAQRHLGVNLGDQDIFVNVSGGFRIKETACDLAVLKAIVSSFRGVALKHDTVYFGEIGLTGTIRKVAYQTLRETECKRLGFKVTNSI